MGDERYIPLALKYRPQSFEDTIGQDVSVAVLKNMIRKDTIYPGLVFYGPRGSGKTSTARIYAKALNCEEHGKGDVPCNKCKSCEEITRTESMVYTEIDGASHGLTEHARKLTDMVALKPLGRYRVVLIDECHMLSNAAWNVLLKTLEEPPPSVVFIFVTTEVSKIPETILSRCFAIPFRFVPPHLVVDRLKLIAQKEGIEIEGDAVLHSIVHRADGAVRDAVVMLDQARMLSKGGAVRMADLTSLGFCSTEVFSSFVKVWMEGKLPEAIALYRQWAPAIGPENFLKGLEESLADGIMFQAGVDSAAHREGLSGMSMGQLWDAMNRIWRVSDYARSDLSRIEPALACAFLSRDRSETTTVPAAHEQKVVESPVQAPLKREGPSLSHLVGTPPPAPIESAEDLERVLS